MLRINRKLTLISANPEASAGIRKANVIVAGSAFTMPRVTRQKSRKIFGRTLENAFEKIANLLEDPCRTRLAGRLIRVLKYSGERLLVLAPISEKNTPN
ncbi:hypothetical protein PWR05_10210 [Paraburkholderia sp. A2RI-6]|uniref:hypothetical protein n=1 Tax=Paraburkholderia sp. A2RI-6 TaxID=3028371 RepID=UPI003B80E0AF